MESLVACVADWLQGERNVKGRRNAFRKSNCFPALSQPPPRGQKAPAHGNRAQAVHTSVCWHLTFLPGKNAGSTMSSRARHTSTGISISTSLLPSHQKPQEHGNAFPPACAQHIPPCSFQCPSQPLREHTLPLQHQLPFYFLWRLHNLKSPED